MILNTKSRKVPTCTYQQWRKVHEPYLPAAERWVGAKQLDEAKAKMWMQVKSANHVTWHCTPSAHKEQDNATGQQLISLLTLINYIYIYNHIKFLLQFPFFRSVFCLTYISITTNFSGYILAKMLEIASHSLQLDFKNFPGRKFSPRVPYV